MRGGGFATCCQTRAWPRVLTMMDAAPVATLRAYLSATPRLEEPDVCRSLSVFPLLGAGTAPAIVTASRRAESTIVVRELPDGAVVNRVRIDNLGDTPVLLYEGQELRGARQDRIVERSVLVPPGSSLDVSVLCVEEKRWDARRAHEAFSPGDRIAGAQLRTTMSRARSTGASIGQTQDLAWSHVRERVSSHRTPTPTMSLSHVFDARAELLENVAARIPVRPRQIGALVAVGGRFVSLDLVSSPVAWSELHRPLLAGHALDALERPNEAPSTPSMRDAARVLSTILSCPVHGTSSAGAGLRVHAAAPGIDVSAIVWRDVAVQLVAHLTCEETP
ncbi:MAG: hypothetical protein IT379_26660 [Deltaproteobacteria bacterium]|nr:hypothetical protein [Deltaproteobacteria bacterium]